jgi:peroxiredoxin
MQQLVKLQEKYSEFKKQGAEVISVFREEKDGAEGIKKARAKTGAAFPILLDPGSAETARYSRGDSFSTYIIARDGKIEAVLEGVKVKRPTAEEILGEL